MAAGTGLVVLNRAVQALLHGCTCCSLLTAGLLEKQVAAGVHCLVNATPKCVATMWCFAITSNRCLQESQEGCMRAVIQIKGPTAVAKMPAA
jgi:hypothetical protein